jgi:cell wall-associated NlpC family hydrolase
MPTDRTALTPLRLRRLVAAVGFAGVSLTSLALAPPSVADAQTVAPDAGSAEAARQVAERRAADHRRRNDLAVERLAALANMVAANVAAERVAPVLEKAPLALGRPYSRGSSGPGAFDCSGFTRWAWQAAGVELPHYTGAQWDLVERIPVEDLQPGDLVFYWSGSGQRGDPGHVGLYVGDGQMIHAPGSGRSVRYESIWYWSGATVAAGRVA